MGKGIAIMRQRLWIVTEVFHPDETATAYIVTRIANKLSEKYNVNVICGPVSSSGNDDGSLIKDINIYRSNHFNYNKDGIYRRTLRFICISVILSFKLLWWSRRNDKVFITTNPAPLVLFIALIKCIRHFELCLLVHDIFPENVVPAGIIKSERSLYFRMQRRLFDWAYTKSDKIVTIGRDMKERVIQKINNSNSSSQVTVIPNWADSNMFISEMMPESTQLVIQYAGNLGRVQGLMDFLTLFHEAECHNVVFSIWGSGAIRKELENYCSNIHTDNIMLNGSFSRGQQKDILRQVDICLIILAEGMYGLGVPSKSYNIMAAGKPVLYIGPKGSEIWRVVEDNGIGYCFEPHDKQAIINFIGHLSVSDREKLAKMGKKAQNLASKFYTEDIVLSQFMDFV